MLTISTGGKKLANHIHSVDCPVPIFSGGFIVLKVKIKISMAYQIFGVYQGQKQRRTLHLI